MHQQPTDRPRPARSATERDGSSRSRPIEDYALISDLESAALVARDGSIDWLCLPRFDGPACFAALLGDAEHGRWLVAPLATPSKITRSYRGDSLVLDTEYRTEEGVVVVTDFMPVRENIPDLIRVVSCREGRVRMRGELVLRFDYGSTVPWVQRTERGMSAIAGPNRVDVTASVPLRGERWRTCCEFEAIPGEVVTFEMTWSPSHGPTAPHPDPLALLERTLGFWRDWASKIRYQGEYREAVVRSLITLKGLTYAPTGAIIAAPTTSLPEHIGGARNWDYRYCWLRDATFTLYALLDAGHSDEATAWANWLRRAVAGRPEQARIMYGVGGERLLPEFELDWLSGYEGSRPVRIGNAASFQHQLDVYGEVLDAFHLGRRLGLQLDGAAWEVERVLADHVAEHWREPDEGIWEFRGSRRQFTHSKVMAWVALDRAIKGVQEFGLHGAVDRWCKERDAVHGVVCREGYDPERRCFTQYFGGQRVDASALMIPAVGFLPATDPRVVGTVEAVERELRTDGLIYRYRPDPELEGVTGEEGAFLACSFWLVDAYLLLGRHDEARALFDHLLSLRNDVGLLSEEYDTKLGRQVGNFPQAFSHIALVNSALNFQEAESPAQHRKRA